MAYPRSPLGGCANHLKTVDQGTFSKATISVFVLVMHSAADPESSVPHLINDPLDRYPKPPAVDPAGHSFGAQVRLPDPISPESKLSDRAHAGHNENDGAR